MSPTGKRFYQSDVVPETDENGEVISVLSVAHDVTELKLSQQHTERALQAMLTVTAASMITPHNPASEWLDNPVTRENLLASVCEALDCEGAVMVILDPDTQVIRDLVVSGFERVTQTILDRVRGQSIQRRFDDASIVTQLEGGDIVELDVSRPPYAERQPRAGLQRAVLIPMRLRQTLVGLITLYPKLDSSFNKEEWMAIARAAGNLAAFLIERERLFAEREEARAAALAAQETARYAEELQRVNEDLKLFSHIVSHDLNEPLRMITSYLDLLKRRYAAQLDPDAGEFIDFAVDGAVRMKTLLTGLLSYTRFGAQESAMRSVDIGSVLQATLHDLSLRIEETGAVVTYDQMPTIIADQQQMGQLFQNLISNALKFCKPDTECRIHIGAERETNGWRFTVQDNGIGIDQKHWQRIFLIFQRLQTPVQSEGTGIGLAICKKIVERHQGSIWLESELGQGSTFFFTLPDNPNAL